MDFSNEIGQRAEEIFREHFPGSELTPHSEHFDAIHGSHHIEIKSTTLERFTVYLHQHKTLQELGGWYAFMRISKDRIDVWIAPASSFSFNAPKSSLRLSEIRRKSRIHFILQGGIS